MAKIIKVRSNFQNIIMKHGYSQVGLSNSTGMSKSAVSLMISGHTGITPENAKKITTLLNQDFDELFEIIDC